MPPPDAVRYEERGASWWSLAIPPVLCAAGALVELVQGERVHVLGWSLAVALLLPFIVLNVRARRRYVSVAVTASTVRFGPESVPLTDIADVGDEYPPLGARVLGGGVSEPRRTTQVALRLVDGTTVAGFARHPDALRDALRAALAAQADWEP